MRRDRLNFHPSVQAKAKRALRSSRRAAYAALPLPATVAKRPWRVRACGDPGAVRGRGRTCRALRVGSAHRSRAARTTIVRQSHCPKACRDLSNWENDPGFIVRPHYTYNTSIAGDRFRKLIERECTRGVHRNLNNSGTKLLSGQGALAHSRMLDGRDDDSRMRLLPGTESRVKGSIDRFGGRRSK